jgi:uncharacterized protein (DUF3820 family)
MSTNITPEFAKAYAEAVSRTRDVVADAENPFHKNSYATLGAHIAATKAIFAQYGLAIVQFPVSNSVNRGEVGVETMVIHKDGGYVSRTILMPVADGVKGQDIGSLVSYLRRYSIAAVANLATADDDAETDREVRTIPAPKLIQLPKEAPKAPAPKAVAPAPKAEAPISAPGSNSDLAKALDFILPFGKNKGSRLGDLAKNSLDWYIKEYQPKPYNGKISDKDIALREALDLIRDAREDVEIISTDDVPF